LTTTLAAVEFGVRDRVFISLLAVAAALNALRGQVRPFLPVMEVAAAELDPVG